MLSWARSASNLTQTRPQFTNDGPLNMSKGKPVLKRSLPRSQPHSKSGRIAFIFTLLLIIFMGWILFRIIHSQPAASKAIQTSTAAPKKILPQKAIRQNPLTAIAPARKQTLPPDSIVFEKDSATFPGRAPRSPWPARCARSRRRAAIGASAARHVGSRAGLWVP